MKLVILCFSHCAALMICDLSLLVWYFIMRCIKWVEKVKLENWINTMAEEDLEKLNASWDKNTLTSPGVETKFYSVEFKEIVSFPSFFIWLIIDYWWEETNILFLKKVIEWLFELFQNRNCVVFFCERNCCVFTEPVCNLLLANFSLVLVETCCSLVNSDRLTAVTVKSMCDHILGVTATE